MDMDVIRRVTVIGQSQGLEKVATDLENVANAQRSVGQAGQATATITDASSRRQISAAQAIDRLRSSMDATYRAQQQLERGQRLVDKAFAQGAIDASQQASMLGLLTQRYQAATAANFISGNMTRLHSGQMQNLTFQLNDMATMLASGQSPFTMLMQQGMQIAQIFGPGVGVRAALQATGSALRAFITSPLTLAVVAFAAAAGGISLLLRSLGNSSTLKQHETAIKQIQTAWKEAGEGARQYGIDSQAAIQFIANQDMRTQQRLLETQLGNMSGQLSGAGAPPGIRALLQNSQPQRLFQAPIQEFIRQAREGTPDIAEFNAEIQRIANMDHANTALQSFARGILAAGQNVTDITARIRELNGELEKTTLVAARSQEAAALTTFRNENIDAALQAQKEQRAALLGVGARSPGQQAAAARALENARPLDPNEAPAVRALRAENAAALAAARAQDGLTQAQEARRRSLEQAVRSAQLDLELIGQTVGEVARLRLQHQLLAQAEEQAAANNVTVSQAEIARIKEKAAEIGRLTQLTAEAKMRDDLLFERRQIFRGPMDQRAAADIRGAGIDPTSQQGRVLSQQIRLNEQLRAGASLARDFASGFARDLQAGVGPLKALSNGLDQLMAKLMQMAIEMLVQRAFGGLVGGGFSLFGGGGALAGGLPMGMGGIGHNAAGTNYWRGGWSLVGEQGPELVRMPRGSQVVPTAQAFAGGGSSEAPKVTVINNGTESSVQQRRSGNEWETIIENKVKSMAMTGALDRPLGNRYGVRARVDQRG